MAIEKQREIFEKCDKLNSDFLNIASDNAGDFAWEDFRNILGGEVHDSIKIETCSYTWWGNIKDEEQAFYKMLSLDTDYVSEEDAEQIHKLQKELKKTLTEMENAEYGDDIYWAKYDESKDIADKIVQIIVAVIKEEEDNYDMDTAFDLFTSCYNEDYYIIDDDESMVYADRTTSYKVNE